MQHEVKHNPRVFLANELEATPLRNGMYAVRPKGQLGTCGWAPHPWMVVYVSAATEEEAVKKAARGDSRRTG